MKNQAVIEIKGVTKTYNPDLIPVHALRGVDLTIQAGEFTALVGPSGSGKTMSALLLESGITDWSKIVVIDTDNHSADLYAHLGQYNVLQLPKPFTPERYT